VSRPFSVVILGLFCIFCFAGCGGGLFLNEEAPVFYTISYDVTSACDALCSHMEQPITIAVWDFDADSPYNKDGMVVKAGEFGISQSARNYWVARPGKILADCLVRDLNEGKMGLEPCCPRAISCGTYGFYAGVANEDRQADFKAFVQEKVHFLSRRYE